MWLVSFHKVPATSEERVHPQSEETSQAVSCNESWWKSLGFSIRDRGSLGRLRNQIIQLEQVPKLRWDENLQCKYSQ